MSNDHQIENSDSAVNSFVLAAELDDVFAALLADADNPELFDRWTAAIDAYRESLVAPWSIRWRNIQTVQRRIRFWDPDRRSNLNALRRAVTAAKKKALKRNTDTREKIEAEAALVAAEDALAIYRQMPSLLTPDDLQRVIGSPHEHQ